MSDQQTHEPDETWFACLTGDCDHETQAECDVWIRRELVEQAKEIVALEAIVRDVGSIALATYAPESGMYNIRIPDATWKAIRAHIRAVSPSGRSTRQELKP